MATLVTLGLSKILGKVGEPTALNFTETGYTAFGLTYEDTCKMSQEDPEVTEFYAEEEDDPVETVEKQGKITFSFSIMNPDLPVLKRLFGGRNSFRRLELSRCGKHRRGIYYHPSEERFEVPSSTYETCSQN